MPTSFTRRQWLLTSGMGAGAGLLLPDALRAMPAAAPSHDGVVDYGALEREATAARRAAGPIRLCFNENPYGMSPKAKAAFLDAWDEHNKYGSSAAGDLRNVFAKQLGVPKECVLVTQGSSEVLSIAAIAYGLHGGEMLAAWPTFETLPAYADTIGAMVHKVPLDDKLAHDLNAMDRQHVNSIQLVYICQPNNPTGTLLENAKLRDYVASASKRAVVMVDEAYHDFVDDPSYRSLVDMVTQGHNLIISRTASKIHGMAGLRVGFAIARPDIIARLRDKMTGNPNTLALRGTAASVLDLEYQTFVKTKNKEGKAILVDALQKLGRRVATSQANFVFFHTGVPVETFSNAMLAKGYMVGRAFPPYNDWARVSIGTPDEMRSFVTALPSALRTSGD